MFARQEKTVSFEHFNQLADPSSLFYSDNHAARRSYRQFLGHAIRYLPPKQREVVMLYFLEEMKMAEVATQLRIHKSTVSRRLAAAQRTLRELAGLCQRSGLFPS